jgi:N-acetylglucosamine-6-phosphate deacetylase
MLRVHGETAADAELSATLDELVAEGARRMLATALEAEVDGYVGSSRSAVGRHSPGDPLIGIHQEGPVAPDSCGYQASENGGHGAWMTVVVARARCWE